MADYYTALAEVDEILNYIEEEMILKIPNDILKIIKKQKTVNTKFKYDLIKPLSEQNLKKETLEILSYINYNFWLNETEKQEFKKIYYNNFEKSENEKRAKYSPDDIFKTSKSTFTQTNNLPVIIEKKYNFLMRFIEKVKAIIKKYDK